MSTGTYTLFTAGSVAPSGTGDFAASGLYGSNSRQTFTFGTSGGTALTLTVAGTAGNLFWTGSGSSWYTGNSASPNWHNTTAGEPSTDFFYANDNVTFSDSGSNPQAVTINGSVVPASLTVSNTSVSYTFTAQARSSDPRRCSRAAPAP